ncbi:MAG: response regulator transcription factor [Acidobacteria bacterium]|nr:response regulator transcription factor [Acidobacteriota bacterium]
MRILIVDDNAAMRRLIRAVLNAVGEIHECADGDEVLAVFARYEPDWVVMDVQMKRLGGIRATRLLKESFPAARVVMLSKHADDDVRAAAREAGACGYLVKDDLGALRRFLLETTNYQE